MSRRYKYKRKASLKFIITLLFMAVILELSIVCAAIVLSGSGSGDNLLPVLIAMCGIGMLSIVIRYTKVFKIDQKGVGISWLGIPYKTLRWKEIRSVGIVAYKQSELACRPEAKIAISYSQDAEMIMYGHDVKKTLLWPIAKWRNTVFLDYSEDAVSVIQYYYGEIIDYRKLGEEDSFTLE